MCLVVGDREHKKKETRAKEIGIPWKSNIADIYTTQGKNSWTCKKILPRHRGRVKSGKTCFKTTPTLEKKEEEKIRGKKGSKRMDTKKFDQTRNGIIASKPKKKNELLRKN